MLQSLGPSALWGETRPGPQPPRRHLILSPSTSLANPFRNPFLFSRISLLSLDLIA